MSDKPRVVFFGSSDFSVPSLASIAPFTNLTVVTRPDAARNRGLSVSKTSVRARADELSIPVATPHRIDARFVEYFRRLKPDVAVLVSYGKILPDTVLDVPRHGFINVHASLLPLHRGPSPIAGALLSGDKETGITIIRLDEKMDHGPILAQRSTAIAPHERRKDLEPRLARLGADLLAPTLKDYLAGAVIPREQQHELATYTKLLTRESGVINWTSPAVAIERMVRAYDPWPGTSTQWNGVPIKIIDGAALTEDQQPAEAPGTVLFRNDRVVIACGEGYFECTLIQPANKKPMDPRSFLQGHPSFIGSVLPS